MKTAQALVAIGGRASRLRSGGVDVPISKSFLTLRGKPLLYWTLKSLHVAGIRDIILCADSEIQLLEADLILGQLSVKFRVRDLLDDGLGVHGLPYHARHMLSETFLFECGHGITDPRHYQEMDAVKNQRNIVISAFQPHPSNLRQPVTLSSFGYVRQAGGPKTYAVAHPMLIDQAYASALPAQGFDISNIIRYHSSTRRLRYVRSNLPPEFDLAEEMRDAMPKYVNFLDNSPRLMN